MVRPVLTSQEAISAYALQASVAETVRLILMIVPSTGHVSTMGPVLILLMVILVRVSLDLQVSSGTKMVELK